MARANHHPPGRAPDPEGPLGPLTRERFMSQVSPCPVTGCWWWTGASSPLGYGVMTVHRRNVAAHRMAVALARGSMLETREHACHRCDQPSCVNPAHLFVGTHLDNMRDMTAKGRGCKLEQHARGSRVGGSKLTEAEVEAFKVAYVRGETCPRDAATGRGVRQEAFEAILSLATWRHVRPDLNDALRAAVAHRYERRDRRRRHRLDTLGAAVDGLAESGPQRSLSIGSR